MAGPTKLLKEEVLPDMRETPPKAHRVEPPTLKGRPHLQNRAFEVYATILNLRIYEWENNAIFEIIHTAGNK